jgi:hypothetical protein
MSAQEPTKVAFYNSQRVRAYRIGGYVYVDQEDLDAITGYDKLVNAPGGYLNPELDKAILDLKSSNPEFADWLSREFGELTLTDYSDIDFTRRD